MAGLAKNISIYSLGNILKKGVQFLLLPLYTHVLLTSDYGKLELTYLLGGIFAILYGLLVESGYTRIYFDIHDEKERRRLFGTGQFFNFVCALFFLFLIYTFSREIASVFLDFAEGEKLLKLVAVSSALNVLTIIPLNNLRNREKAKTFVLVNLVTLTINIGLTILFLVVWKTGVSGILYAQIVGAAVELPILYVILYKDTQISFNVSVRLLKAMLNFSVFLILPGLSSLVITMSNRYFLQEYQSLEDVGLFSLGYKIAAIIPFLITEPVKKAFGPHIFGYVNEPDKCRNQLVRFTRYFVAILSVVVLLLSVFAYEMIYLMSDQSYHSSYSIVFVLAMSYLLMGVAGIVVLGIQITKKTWIITAIWPFAAAINVALNIWLIPLYAKEGATYATIATTFFILISYFIATRRVYNVHFEYLKYIIILILTVIFYYLSTFFTGISLFLSLPFKVLLIFLFLLVVLKINYFSNEEIEQGKKALLKLLQIKV